MSTEPATTRKEAARALGMNEAGAILYLYSGMSLRPNGFAISEQDRHFAADVVRRLPELAPGSDAIPRDLVAEFAGVSATTIRNVVKNGDLDNVLVNRRAFITVESFVRWFDSWRARQEDLARGRAERYEENRARERDRKAAKRAAKRDGGASR